MKKTLMAVAAAMLAAVGANAQEIIDTPDAEIVVAPNLLMDYYMNTEPLSFLPDELRAIDLLSIGKDDEIIEFEIDAEDGITEEEVGNALTTLQNDLADYARKFLGTKYVWGAKGPKAFDCSGFTGYVFKNFGYDIGPCSRTQATRGQKVDIKDARVGDLMFFTRPKGGKTVGHVGMVIDVDPETGSLKFIHASTKKGVTIQQFPDNGHYNRRFLQVRRVIDDDQLVTKS